MTDNYDIIDEEDTGSELEDTDSDELISPPFDSSSIRISTSVLSIGQLITRIKEKEINLAPDFQREFVWKDGTQSRLIESMFIQFPLPAFYMDATNDDNWLVIDGLQRLRTAERFAVKNELRLRDLEFLGKELNGMTHNELPRYLQRRIDETQVTVYKIEKGTPMDVRYNLFKRINTGGLALRPQEIRHALFPGQANPYLAKLAESDEFRRATNESIRDKRMTDREMVLRFLAFSMTSYKEYHSRMGDFLNENMVKLNKMSQEELDRREACFLRAMRAAYDIFGQWAFRKIYSAKGQYQRVIKPLFEAWSVNLDKLSDSEIGLLIKRREDVKNKFIQLMCNRYFDAAVSVATDVPNRVRTRFESIENLIREVLV